MNKTLILNNIKEYLNLSSDLKLANYLGITPQNLSNWKKRNTFDAELIYTKCEFIDANWLLTGQGKMLKQENDQLPVTSSNKLIPFYDSITIGGTESIANLDSDGHPVEYIDAGDWFRDATAAMRVHGDSMFPIYKSGSIVALKKVDNISLIVPGQDYVVETSEYRVIKRLQHCNDKNCLLCCSVNNEKYEGSEILIHQPFEVEKQEIRRLFRVLGNVCRNESSRIVFNSSSRSE